MYTQAYGFGRSSSIEVWNIFERSNDSEDLVQENLQIPVAICFHNFHGGFSMILLQESGQLSMIFMVVSYMFFSGEKNNNWLKDAKQGCACQYHAVYICPANKPDTNPGVILTANLVIATPMIGV